MKTNIIFNFEEKYYIEILPDGTQIITVGDAAVQKAKNLLK